MNRSWLWWWWPTIMWFTFTAFFVAWTVQRIIDGQSWWQPATLLVGFAARGAFEVWRTRREQQKTG